MKIKTLFKNIQAKFIMCDCDMEINDIQINSNFCKEGTLFFCLSGHNTSGYNYIEEAVNNGAICIVCDKEINTKIPHIVVNNIRQSLALVSSNFYGNPKSKLKIIGITGTNGKTTCSYIIKHILQSAGKKVGIIGTLGGYYNGKKLYENLTTPDTLDFHKLLNNFVDLGAEYVVMEVSAHAIALEKIYGIDFEIGVFTNLTQDHLDYFGNMERYGRVKKSFFDPKHIKCAVINTDDEMGLKIASEEKTPLITYGINFPCDVFAIDIVSSINKTEFVANIMDNIITVNTKLIGKYNIYNILASLSTCVLLGIDTNILELSINTCPAVEGRCEIFEHQDKTIIIDFAHTPDALNNLLKMCRSFCKHKIITVFGTPGSRDTTKRHIMGEIVEKYSDYVVVTSDNPRYENPFLIFKDITSNLKTKKIKYIENRRQAILFALSLAKFGDFVILCGKGGEKYQDINSVKVPYNEVEEIKILIGEK